LCCTAAPDKQTATGRLVACVAEIERWMTSDQLKLNADKTEFIWLGKRQQQLTKISMTPLQVGSQLKMPLTS